MSVNRQSFLNQCFIQDWVDGSFLPFQLMPDEVAQSKSVNWQDQEVMGRAFPVKGYGSSSARTVQLQLLFCADLGIDGNTVEIPKIAAWCMALAYPDYKSGLIAPPHPVYLQVGSMIKMKGVVGDVVVTHRGPWDFDTNYGRIIEVSMSIQEVGEIPYGLTEVRNPDFSPKNMAGRTEPGTGKSSGSSGATPPSKI